MTKYAFKNLVKQCLAEVIVENPTGPWTVRYAVLGLEGIPNSEHTTKGEAIQAAKDFIQSYNTAKSRKAGEYMEGIPDGYALKHLDGGTRAVAVVIAPPKNKFWEESQPEPYDPETDTFAPGPRDRTEPVKLKLTPTGREDEWSRPIYKGSDGKIYVDINMDDKNPSIHSVTDQGEPDVPVRNFTIVGSAKKNEFPNALCPRCKNSDPKYMKQTPDGKMSCMSCHWEENPGEPRPLKEVDIRPDKLTNSERRKIHDAFKKVGLDGNGRFEKKEQGLAAVTNALSALGFQLDMVSGDMIMGDKGARNFIFRRANDQGQDPYTEKPEITNSRITFNWERMDGPTHQYPNSPHAFEILAYAS